MMKQKLEEYRLETHRQLDHEQANRTSRANDLRAEASELDAENKVAAARMRRASHAMPAASCPRCWIWDGEKNEMEAKTDDDAARFFQCTHCGHTLEAASD